MYIMPKKWEKFKHQLPTARDNIPYGTPDLALEIERLNENNILKSKTIKYGTLSRRSDKF